MLNKKNFFRVFLLMQTCVSFCSNADGTHSLFISFVKATTTKIAKKKTNEWQNGENAVGTFVFKPAIANNVWRALMYWIGVCINMRSTINFISFAHTPHDTHAMHQTNSFFGLFRFEQKPFFCCCADTKTHAHAKFNAVA